MPTPSLYDDPNPVWPIRPALPADLDVLHAILWPDAPRDWVAALLRRCQQHALQGRGLGVVVLAEPAGPVAAYGQLTLWPRAAEISDLMVAATYRGRGIGTAMIQYLTRTARDMRASRVEIGVAQDNPRARALYVRLGFVPDRVLPAPQPGEASIDVLAAPLHRPGAKL